MTVVLSSTEDASQISAVYPEAVMESGDQAVVINSEYLLKVAEVLKGNPSMPFNYLTDLTAVDYFDYFEVVYRLTSLEHNTMLVLKVRLYDRQNPALPSVTGLWKGADYMEREVFDLLGIVFTGHPNLKRIVTWDGFQGYPLRKDYL